MKEKALITGATGFIGFHLASRLLKEGHEVYCLARRTSDKKTVTELLRQGGKVIYGDLTDLPGAALPKGIDWVFHLAAIVDTADKYSYGDLYRNNCLPTRQLADYYLVKIKRFVFLSSMAAIGIRDENNEVTEDTKCQPTTNYGRSKLEAEEYLLRLYGRQKFPSVILRPPTVYGPGDKYNFLKLVRAISQKRFMIIGSGENKMSYCYVKNLVEALILAAKSQNAAGQVFLIDDGRPYRLEEVASAAAKAMGKNIPGFHLPYWLAYPAAIGLEILGKLLRFEPPLSRSRINTMCSNFPFDVQKAKKLLKYKPGYQLEEAVAETIAAFTKERLI